MLSVIIVDYKTIEKTIDYIHHLEEFLISKDEIHYIIVDNTPDAEGEKTFIEAFNNTKEQTVLNVEILNSNNKYIYCKSYDNLGYAKGNNVGADVSRSIFNDGLLLISNNDIRLKSRLSINKVVAEMKDGIAVIGPKVIGLDGVDQSPYRKPSFLNSMIVAYLWPINHIRRQTDVIPTNCSGPAYRIMGCFMFIDTDSFYKVGGFDANTFLYYEEAILAERLKNRGLITYYKSDIEIVHEHEGTTKKVATRDQTIIRYYKSGYYYFKAYRNIPEPLLLASKAIFTLYILERRVAKMLGWTGKK